MHSRTGYGRYVTLLRAHTRGRRGMFAVVAAALVAGAGVQVASPLVVRAFLDLARAGAAVERLVAVARVSDFHLQAGTPFVTRSSSSRGWCRSRGVCPRRSANSSTSV